MIKLTIDDFLYEIKDEIMCYEDLGEKKALDFEKDFNLWLNKDIKHKNIKTEGDKKYYLLSDESEIFDIVDLYYEAVEENKEKDFWNKFQ